MTNTLQKNPPCSFCISPCVFWAVESKKYSCKHFHLYQVNSGGQICCIGITYTRAFLPAPPGDGKDGSSGCPATPAGLGGGGLQAGRPCPGGLQTWAKKVNMWVLPCHLRAPVPKRKGNNMGGTVSNTAHHWDWPARDARDCPCS